MTNPGMKVNTWSPNNSLNQSSQQFVEVWKLFLQLLIMICSVMCGYVHKQVVCNVNFFKSTYASSPGNMAKFQGI